MYDFFYNNKDFIEFKKKQKNTNPEDKIFNRKDLSIIINELKIKYKVKIVFTNGCFDIIHCGHIEYLLKASRLGDIFIVALNTDDSVKKLKGTDRPIINLMDRMKIIASMYFVDFVTFFNELTPVETIKIIKPDIHVKGGDYKEKELVEYSIVKAYGGEVKIIDFLNGYSTTNIIKKIKRNFNC